jgi:hypothetical protein
MALSCLTNRLTISGKFLVTALMMFSPLGDNAFAQSADWLAVDLSMTGVETSETRSRQLARNIFDDDQSGSVTTAQNIRHLMNAGDAARASGLVDEMISGVEISATDWLRSMPKSSAALAKNSSRGNECYLDSAEGRVSCGNSGSMRASYGEVAPAQREIGQDLVRQIARVEHFSGGNGAVNGATLPIATGKGKENKADNSSVTLYPRKDGLVTVEGGKIEFAHDHDTKKVLLSDALQGVELSIFVRDPSVVSWDDVNGILRSHKAGASEVFVVTPGRISIIETKVTDVAGVNVAKDGRVKGDLEVSAVTASLDGLDRAINDKSAAASLAANALEAKDLEVSEGVSTLGPQAAASTAHFARSKTKANFESVRIKFVDDRSELGGTQYPVSGVRVKVAGTEFSELTNHLGEVDIKDVPSGARLLLDVADSKGYIMPQAVEVVVDRVNIARTVTQIVTLRRFASLDLTARGVGVVQDMRKSSLCGVVHHQGSTRANVRVSIDAHAVGPVYMNNLGFPDTRLGATAAGGKFCFFNVESGPVTIGFSSGENKEQLAGVIGLVPGRHAEEAFNLGEARHVSTTLTAIASANEQLGSDEVRSARHDLVEQTDIYAVGSGQLMVPVDEGIMTTPTPVLPVKGRIWTVSASSDFETSIQAVSVKAPLAKQISTLIPNGFMEDMSVFAQTHFNRDQGGVVIEHGNLTDVSADGTKMRLVDAFGRDVGDGWYFADKPVSKAVFFNVPPGVYALVIETSSGHWIAADTVMVYSEAVSFAKTGGQIERVSSAIQRASLN